MKITPKSKNRHIHVDFAYFWNTLAGLINAGQSVLFMVVITRSCGIVNAGIFSFAFANANLFLCIGKYGIKKFQATDLNEEYSFGDYFFSRVITTFVMFIGILLYSFVKNDDYTFYKSLTIVIVGLLKTVDSFDDVFLGMFQQKKRLDIGARNSCLRNTAMLIISSLIIITTKNMVLGLTIGFGISLIMLIFLNLKSLNMAEIKSNYNVDIQKLKQLLWVNLPLVIGDFLTIYITNCPKYAIDNYLTEEIQAIYGIIAQPVLIVALFSDFIFNPILVVFSECWLENNVYKFIKLLIRQIFLIGLFTFVVLTMGYLIGVPILSIIYDVDISKYRREFMLLLLGGGFAAISSFLYVLIACIRKQKVVVPILGIVATIAVCLTPVLVAGYELLGASLLYLGTAGLLALFWGSILFWNLLKVRIH